MSVPEGEAADRTPGGNHAPSYRTLPERTGKELIAATRPFATESPARTAWSVVSTFCLLGAAVTLAGFRGPWPFSAWGVPPTLFRAFASIVAGFLTVRGFILFHDVMHGALLRGSSPFARLGRALFHAYGVLVLTPPTVWRQTHNYHHANTAKIAGSHVGSYIMLTPEIYRSLTPAQQRMYRLARHPLNMLLGYVTIFGVGMCLRPFLKAPRKNWDSGVALVVHVALVATLTLTLGGDRAFFSLVLPLAVACTMGAYLFYAQHNFPGIDVQPREKWSYTHAALESSSFMKLDPVLQYLTGNIGYHHVHHLNPSIPFYRLPEAMAAVPELSHPHVTTLRPRDVLACFRLKLWDPASRQMVGYDS